MIVATIQLYILFQVVSLRFDQLIIGDFAFNGNFQLVHGTRATSFACCSWYFVVDLLFQLRQ